MTDQQKKLVEDNHNLIYWFLHTYHLNEEDYYDLAAIGLCNAAINFNSDICKFSTFAIRCMYNSVFSEYRKRKNQKYIPDHKIQSYDCCLYDNTDTELLDLLASDENLLDKLEFQILLKEFLDTLDNRDIIILQLRLKGCNQSSIASYLGISQSYTSRLIKNIRNRYSDYVNTVK